MTTQTLRGLAHQGPMHWRGDRTGATFVGDPLRVRHELAFEAFNVAFDSLLGRDEGELSDADMQAFTDFVLQIQPPPNPIRSLDNQLTAAQANGRSAVPRPRRHRRHGRALRRLSHAGRGAGAVRHRSARRRSTTSRRSSRCRS